MRKITFVDRLRYRFDNTMSKGPIALIGWLFLVTLAFIAVLAIFIAITGISPAHDDGSPRSFTEVTWLSILQTLNANLLIGDLNNSHFMLAILIATLGGLLVVGSLIGVLTSSIEHRLDVLRKGRSFVIEDHHTAILGWSPQIFTIVSELVIASANQPRACIAILADKDKVEMEDELRAKAGHTGHTRIVCRTGSPIDLADLEIVNPHMAKSIIILAPEVDDPDSHVIKSILALTNNPHRRSEPYHIVAEIRDPKNLEVARMVGRDEAQLVLAGDLIARIAVQTSRQSGLSVVYTELLDFEGDEIYFQEERGLVGKTFGEALFAYEDSALIGLRFKDGRLKLNPPMGTRIEAGDKAIAISEDDDTVRLSGLVDYGIDASAILAARPAERTPERTLILGWNRRAPTLIAELNNYVAPGSIVKVVAEPTVDEMERSCQRADLHNQSVSFKQGDTTDRRTLDDLDIPTYQHVITLSYADTHTPQEADARTLVTLLHLRDIADKAGHPFSIVSEMLDVRNRELAEVTRADDFIVSDKLVSLMLSQISENPELSAVFADLFDPEGSELYLKPAGDYVQLGKPLNFYTVVEAARRRGEVAVGYRLRAQASDAAQAYGVRVNPDKSKRVTFGEGDRVILLAED